MDMMELRRNIIMGSSLSLKEYTATGNPLTFLTDLARPLKSCVTTWQPLQSGTGDPSPENIRSVLGMDGVNVWHTGKNLLDPSAKTTTALNDNVYFYKNDGLYLPAGTYTVSASVNMTAIYVVRKSDGTNVALVYSADKKTFTLSEETAVYVNYYKSGGVGDAEYMLEVGETATEYSPYHGTFYSVAFPATGKNLVPPFVTEEKTSTGLTMTPQSDGSVRVHGKSTSQEYALISRVFLSEGQYALKAGTYTFRINTDGQGSNLYTQVVLSNGTVFFSDRYGETKTIPDCYISRVDIGVAPSAYNIDIDETISPQLEAGSTPTAYEPYTSTVYGGSLDLTTGVLTAEWWSFAPKWKDKWYGQQLTNAERRVFEIPSGIAVHTSEYYNTNKSEVMCNRATWKWSFSEDSIHFYIGVDQGKNVAIVFQPIGTDEDTEIHICGTLDTPQTFQLSPTQITALIGNNTMWADSDSLEIKYLKKR